MQSFNVTVVELAANAGDYGRGGLRVDLVDDRIDGWIAGRDALGTFVRRSKGNAGGRIVGFTTASADPMGSALAWRSFSQRRFIRG